MKRGVLYGRQCQRCYAPTNEKILTTDEVRVGFLHGEHAARRARILRLACWLHAVRRDVVIIFGICTLYDGQKSREKHIHGVLTNLPFPIGLQCPPVLLTISRLEFPRLGAAAARA